MSLSIASIILLADIAVFTVFEVIVLTELGVPKNLSITYYMFKERKTRLQWFFPAVTLFLCVTTMPIWIYNAYYASGWHSKFVAFPVFTLFCLLAVTASANYLKNQRLKNFHYTCAILAAVCFLVWLNSVAIKLAYVGSAILLVLLFVGIRTKTLKKCPLFWLESAAFYSLLFTLLVIEIKSVGI